MKVAVSSKEERGRDEHTRNSLLNERLGDLVHDLPAIVHVDGHTFKVRMLVDLGLADGHCVGEGGCLL
jgi:hypothetical protein